MNLTSTSTRAVHSLSALALLITGAALYAGPLTPPAGPVAPTLKTLTEVEPRTAINPATATGSSTSVVVISQSGSYYLTANLVGAASKHGITIAASGVTLDLNGFEVIGNGDTSGDFDGIRVASANIKNVTVRNGHVRNWGADGIDIANFVGTAGAHIENVRSTGNGGTGIACSTTNGVVINCLASENNGTGISATRLISGCSSVDNGGIGLAVGQGGSILNSVSFSNDGDGISTGFSSTVAHCTSGSNGGNGVVASNGTTITDSSFTGNFGSGINVFNSITIRGCTAVSNQLWGIDTDASCLIENSTANSNTLGGIRSGSRSVIRNNIANGNATGTEIGPGILMTGSDARIEGNSCNTNDFGIDIDGTGNIIIRNTCAGNTQGFIIAADNFYGPIIDRRIPTPVSGTAAVIGFSATSTLGSSDSNANFAQ
ncbi:MAG: right-handed parallel beta-helix repeat-containing protein [Phycisphaerales bacterium]|nr:right-handed parallel beta-helix repeat-containing protein [Phycisphaerales bacterium]